jgi:hypothetical protein
MSIYNPPSKTQSVFNPSNFGGLGADGQITTDYLDANYLQFPVAQGNMTLVGTNVLGDVTQQGELITTGDITGETIKATSILVGTTNVITEIGTKQDTINDGDLTIAKTNGLQTALDNKYDDTGGTIGGDVTISGDLVVGTTNVITEIGTKQDTIQDNGLTIAKTDGLQTALDNKYDDTGGTIGGNVTINGDLVVGTTNVITEIGTKQDTINDGGLTIAKTDGLQTALDNKYDDTGGTIGGNVTINGDLVIGTTNIITEIGTKQDTIQDNGLTIAKTSGLQTALNNKYNNTGGTIGGNVTINGDLVVGTTNVITEIGTKQDTIQDNGLTIAKTSGLQTALNNKYDDTGGTIDGNVDISGDLVVGSTNIITELGTKQDTIQDNGLTIAKTDGLQTALDAKQATIDEDTDLSSNSLNTNQLTVNDDLYFDTIVIRRITANNILHFRELQLWVNDVNELPSYTIPSSASNNTSTNVSGNALGETIEFFNNTTTLTALVINGITYTASNIANEIIDGVGDTGYDTVGTTNTSLYIPLNTTININEVQSIVLYNRFDTFQSRAIGFAIELYNRADDPTLSNILVSTNAISTAKRVYRYDFPAIDTYPSGDFSDTDSISQIASETLALKEVVSDIVYSKTNIITELGTKQPTITSATDLSCNSITTTENATIGGTLNVSGSLSNPNQPCFKVIRTNTSTSCDTGDNLKFNEATIDNSTAYNSTNFEYTIPVAGNWYFYYSFAADGDDLKVQLQQNGNIRDELSTFTTTTPVTLPSNYSLGCKGMVIIPCVVNDVIRVRVADGSVSLNHTNELHSFGGFLIG